MASEKRKDSRGRNLPKNVTQRRDGTYQAAITIDGQRKYLYSRDLKKLKERVEQAQEDAKNGISSQNPLLNKYFDSFVETVKKPRLKESSYNSQLESWNLYVRNGLGRKRIKDVRRTDVIKMLDDLILKKGLARNTINIVQALLCDCFDSAMKDNLIVSNPAAGIGKEIAKTKDAKVKEIITPEQAKRLFDYMNNNAVYSVYVPMFTLMFQTGMRVSETLGLTWSDVDIHNSLISINHEIVYGKHSGTIEFYVTPPKTKSSIRTIPLTKDAKTALISQREITLLLGLPDVEIDGLHDFIFRTRCGKPYTTNQINRTLKTVIDSFNRQEQELAERENREADLMPHLSSHCFRHSFATALCESTDDLKSIQSLLGHSSINITMDTYVSATEGRKREAMIDLEERLSI